MRPYLKLRRCRKVRPANLEQKYFPTVGAYLRQVDFDREHRADETHCLRDAPDLFCAPVGKAPRVVAWRVSADGQEGDQSGNRLTDQFLGVDVGVDQIPPRTCRNL